MDGRSGAHHSGRSRISRRLWGSVTQIEPSPEARKNGVVRGSRRWDVTLPVAGLARSTEVHGYSTGTAQAVLDHAPPGARLVFFVRVAHHTRWPGRVLVEAQGDRQGLRPARAPRALRRPRRVGFINSIRLQIRRIGKVRPSFRTPRDRPRSIVASEC